MNKERRKQISAVTDRLDNLQIGEIVEKITGQLEELMGEVGGLRDDEQESYDAMPENLQGSEKADLAEEAVQFLDEAADQLNQLISHFNEAEEQFLQAIDQLNQAEG